MKQNQIIAIAGGVIIVVLIGVAVYQSFHRGEKLSEGAATTSTQSTSDSTAPTEEAQFETVHITNGTRHTVPLDRILGGGPPKDGIPSIDNPKFISVSEASKDLSDDEPGIAIEFDGESRFYPFQILVWHEIVNDQINDRRFLVTYCPLCLSGIVFDPVVDGERVEFGTSGKLWNSNLVMYDRKNESYWSQILGEAIVGSNAGESLVVLPSDQIRYGNWKAAHPDGSVLSRDTGATRFYGRDPYGEYYTTPGTFFPVDAVDDRLEDKAYILGVVIDGEAKAYLPEMVQQRGVVEDTVGGVQLRIEYDESIDAVRFFTVAEDGTSERFNPFPSFWFSWVAAHPETAVFK